MKLRNLLIQLIGLISPISLFCAEIPIQVQHAVTPAEQQKGLMGRTSLGPNEGMTFNFSNARHVTFWMYNCHINLSIAFLDENKVIQEIYELEAHPEITDKQYFQEHSASSSFPASYVLEMPEGWFARNQVHVGDHAVWSTDSPNALIITSH